ncbi:MAG: pyridoxamine 5'-phosphate oxidase [Bdellovibrionaceae bacterium]|nr:pyridoxamine 5'-phosphate oxidase [Pseudobdellovibrionaceae bacterium]
MTKPIEDPLDLFTVWYKEVEGSQKSKFLYLIHPIQLGKKILQSIFGVLFPAVSRIHSNAVILATADKQGRPASRVVLLKKYSKEGFFFYTNYGSQKAQDIAENPQVSFNFYWEFPHRQVRIYGKVKKTSYEDSAAYWDSRPKESQISSFISHQSHKIASRKELEEKTKEVALEYKDKPLPCPEFWGGYVLSPEKFEFWQARTHRLHDRMVYEKDAVSGQWSTYHLAP